MSKSHRDRLEHQSLLLMGATMVSHVGNVVFHLITGRYLPGDEYGLMIALFGAVNLLLLPMSALQVSLTRAVASLSRQTDRKLLSALLRRWWIRLSGLSLTGLVVAGVASPALLSFFGTDRVSTLMMAACIPVLNLFLTLCGAGLQGLQKFGMLSLRGCSLYVLRAALVGGGVWIGMRTATAGLLAHLAGMTAALAVSVFSLRALWKKPDIPYTRVPVLPGSLLAFPVLLAFSALMTADVILVRALHPGPLSGEFAQAATLGRMILWLPLPIAQVMFPKVVRTAGPTRNQRTTLYKAMAYTMALVMLALAGLWLLGKWGFELVFGTSPTPDQVNWLRGMGVCMALLGPVYVVMQYELARNRIRRLLPCCAVAALYLGTAWFGTASPDEVILLLAVAGGVSLLTAVRALATEPDPPPDPSLSESA
jgi:O-antigen/teichoic acid export membrane protein